MKYPNNIREEELKNKVGQDWFADFDTTQIIGNIDFSVFPTEGLFKTIPLLWAEAKKGDYDIVKMFVQLILTIGKERTFNKMIPPTFLAAFDCTKIAFLPYNSIDDVFTMNDFNWNVTPSNYETKEFQLLKTRIENSLQEKTYTFNYLKDEKELHTFIKQNVLASNENAKQTITKNNFFHIYLRWLDIVKPIIKVDWNELKKHKILDCDFYLADLFVDDKGTENIDDDTAIADNLFVIFEDRKYKIRKENLKGLLFDQSIEITNKKAYQNFWKLYKRPPHESFHDYIMQRRDLLVPQDVRERKGSFFTPQQWVALSQQYLADTLGENWQDEYYIWDCAAGTGNLLAGLTNKYNIYASTLDDADINVMRERITHGANLLDSHIFQFDFLNDGITEDKNGNLISSLKDCEKIPQSLRDILSDPEKTKKLIIYINPPYAEATASDTITGKDRHKAGVSDNKTYKKYIGKLKRGINEVFAQFLARIYYEIPNCKIGEFSTLKILQSQNFSDFRKEYRAKLEKIFIIPANTFDNVKGQFPIGFKIWDTAKEEVFKEIQADLYDKDSIFQGKKHFFNIPKNKVILNWMQQFYDKINPRIAYMVRGASDFQNNQIVFITLSPSKAVVNHSQTHDITINNLIPNSIFFTARRVIEHTWCNNQDQFLYPKDGWQEDKNFQTNCLAYTLFANKNNISISQHTNNKEKTPAEALLNHWIPFTEEEVNAPEKFKSNFMSQFIAGKLGNKPPHPEEHNLFTLAGEENPHQNTVFVPTEPLQFTPEAQAVFQAGKALWQYYFTQPNPNPNASLYDIREHFQGRNEKGKMNNKSEDETYNRLIATLRQALATLAKAIEPKVYEYQFLL
ncbi:hypothetical protein [Capnocytophaga gingivalis]|uniref:Site-specific DNA-methyltransferase (adenine-specific) n=1 Tax=Capnocytophaga gingivalis TaxID=1017 RepID=A0ABU5Y9U3_9FLAO|nr:hypothetical protein [Capnocytophaga gingivalis]MEB3040700.1 hypothetical protein [Capnocytophaga gingivalis]